MNYNEEIESFTNKTLTKELWEQFCAIPMNWNGFAKGTPREEILSWFENSFHVDVEKDLMDMTQEEKAYE